MIDRTKPPKARDGYVWEFREGCPDDCKCPWGANCLGHTWPHWRERRIMTDKRYRECMAEIIGVLKKYDMAGAITVVSKERAMFKYHFPTWSCLILGEDQVRFRSKREDYPSAEAQHRAGELSAHIIMQMRDIAANTFVMAETIGKTLTEKLGMVHVPNYDFDPERDN